MKIVVRFFIVMSDVPDDTPEENFVGLGIDALRTAVADPNVPDLGIEEWEIIEEEA